MSDRFTVSAWRNRQLNQAFDLLGAGAVAPAKATVEVISGGKIYAYASKVDNATGDPTNIVAIPRPE